MLYIAIASDLIFRSKIREAAGNIPVQFVKSEQGLEPILHLEGDKTFLIDLACTGLDVLSVIPKILSLSSTSRCICYCSHVDEERMKKAHSLGADEVMPKSKFVRILPEIFRDIPTVGGQHGASTVTLLVFGSLVAAAIYYAYHVLPFYYYYYELRNQMQAAIKLASSSSDDDIRKQIKHVIKHLEIPVAPEALKIQRQDHFMRMQIEYREIFYVTWRKKDYTIQYFDFDAQVEGQY